MQPASTTETYYIRRTDKTFLMLISSLIVTEGTDGYKIHQQLSIGTKFIPDFEIFVFNLV
jgi:hypothetical protein